MTRAGRGRSGSTSAASPPAGSGTPCHGRNTCANDAATRFLTTGERPVRDLACAAGPSE
ncbi:alpha/beta hydrolase [Streptomyces sp. NPDC059906]|uniref:alpha/beta hydrolase n=1 Tax=Streptomyces sp. NPDC059906 TaxID=3346997 RepID=UPI0036562008